MKSVVFGVVAIASILTVNSVPLSAHENKPGMTPRHSGDGSHSGATHRHGTVEIPQGQPVPTVKLVVHPDPMNGWNLELRVANFAFAPERVNTKDNRSNEGHAHLYINGQKVARLYGNWYHLPNSSLKSGLNKITVTLNTNGHDDLLYQGKVIQDTAMVEVPVRK